MNRGEEGREHRGREGRGREGGREGGRGGRGGRGGGKQGPIKRFRGHSNEPNEVKDGDLTPLQGGGSDTGCAPTAIR